MYTYGMDVKCNLWGFRASTMTSRLCIPGEFLGIPLGFPFSASKKREFGFLRRREPIIYDVQTKRNEAKTRSLFEGNEILPSASIPTFRATPPCRYARTTMRIGRTSSHAGRSDVGVDARTVVSPPPSSLVTVRVTRVHPDVGVGVDIRAAPPRSRRGTRRRRRGSERRRRARDGVRKDDGSGRRHHARDDRLRGYARTRTLQIDTTIKKLVRDGDGRGEEDDGHEGGWGEQHNNARVHPNFGVDIRAAPH